MSEGGQRGTGNDYVLYLFYFIILYGEVRGVGGGGRTETCSAAGRTAED